MLILQRVLLLPFYLVFNKWIIRFCIYIFVKLMCFRKWRFFSEGQGIRRLTAELCDFLVRIPMAGVIESLNVSVATGVCLFEIRRQRSRGQPAR